MIVLCPGIHSPALTQGFLQAVSLNPSAIRVFPTEKYPAYSAWHLIQFVEAQLGEGQRDASLLLIGFSAGVVAAIATAYYWQARGRTVQALIAVDGWGVPLYGSFPIHRISHDYFTHWSSSLAEPLGDCFYADPPVAHLDLWRSPASASGQWVNYTPDTWTSSSKPWPYRSLSTRSTAAEFIARLLDRYTRYDSC